MNKHSPTGKRRRRRHPSSAALSDDRLYHSASEFGRRLGVGRTTVWRMMQRGQLRYMRLSPTLVRIPVTEYARLERVARRETASAATSATA